MHAKIDVNGEGPPALRRLAGRQGRLLGATIKWNFTKFLVDRDGKVVERYASTTKPEKIAKDIEKALAS